MGKPDEKEEDQIAFLSFGETANGKILAEVTRVPFNLWVFLLFFLSFRLFCLANEVENQREDFKANLVSVCGTVENATNQVINLHKTLALASIEETADMANKVVESGLFAVRGTVNITVGALFTLLDLQTVALRCTTAMSVTLAYEYLSTRMDGLEILVNSEIGTILSVLEDGLDLVRDKISVASTAVAGYINKYNAAVADLNQHNINLPPLVVTFPTIPHINIPPVDFPTNTSAWQEPDFFGLQEEMFQQLNPVGYINRELDKIKLVNVTAEQLIEQLGAEAALAKTTLSFCVNMNFTKFDREVDKFIMTIHGAVGVTLTVVCVVMLAEVSAIIFRHKKMSLRPSWFPEGGTLDRFLKHIWHRPSLTCLLVGILGMIIFSSLRYGISVAEEAYQREVLGEIQGFASSKISLLNEDLDQLSAQFAAKVNGDLDQIRQGLEEVRHDINSTLNKVLGVQDLVNGYLEEKIASIPYAGDGLFGMVQCLASVLTLPVGNLINLFPNISAIPSVNERVLTFNLTRAQLMVNETLQETTYPFAYYDAKLAEDLFYYYYLMAYGCPVLLVGLATAIWEILQERR